jgi:hypothetical protein
VVEQDLLHDRAVATPQLAAESRQQRGRITVGVGQHLGLELAPALASMALHLLAPDLAQDDQGRQAEEDGAERQDCHGQDTVHHSLVFARRSNLRMRTTSSRALNGLTT